jgi:endonuclease V-like protein UPF0215 family
MRRGIFRATWLTSCIGIEDGPFLPRRLGGSKAPLVVVKLDGPHVTRIQAGWIDVDGLDATERALKLLASMRVSDCPILLDGVTFGGFNLIDPRELQRRFRTPTIVAVGSRPDNRAVKRALVRHFPDWKKRWQIIRGLGPLRRVRTVAVENPIYYESFGCPSTVARRILSGWAIVSRMPEPLRVAGLVARGLFPAQPLD